MPAPLLVLGIGNALARDDGLGVHAIRALAAERATGGGRALAPGVDLLDGGTAGLSLLPAIAGARALVVIDAVNLGAPPGTVKALTRTDLGADPLRLSVHQVGTADLLAAARLTARLPDQVVLIGVQPATVAAGTELSPAVAAALPQVLAAVYDWCDQH